MGQGYIRNDTANNIADGNVADAADIDGEFDAIVAAFVNTTGHTHDGTLDEGGAITVVGPAQDYVGGAADFSPKTDSTYDLGTTSVRWATGYLDDLTVTSNIVVGGTVDGRDVATDGTKLDGIDPAATADQTGAEIKVAYEAEADTNAFTDALLTKLNGIEAAADVTDTANVTAAGALMDSEVDADIKTLSLPASTTISAYGATLVDDLSSSAARTTLGLGTIATQASSSVTITGGSITGITDIAVADGGTGASTAAGALTNLGLTATAAEINILDGITATTVELNYVDGVTSAIQTQLNAKASSSNPVFTGSIEEQTGTMPAGTTPAINPANGTVQEWTLTGNSSPTDSLTDGEFVELLIQDGTAYTITWPTITWLTDGALAPTLGLTTVTPVLVQKVGSTLYGRRTGDGG